MASETDSARHARNGAHMTAIGRKDDGLISATEARRVVAARADPVANVRAFDEVLDRVVDEVQGRP